MRLSKNYESHILLIKVQIDIICLEDRLIGTNQNHKNKQTLTQQFLMYKYIHHNVI